MTNRFRCPSQDPFHGLKSTALNCPNCCAEYEVFSDEAANKHHHCMQCGTRIVEMAFLKNDGYRKVLDFARALGVTDAKLIAAEQIVVEDRFRALCETPRCENFGTSLHCPPHSMTPAEFRRLLGDTIHVLAFKFDLPVLYLPEEERHETGHLLHDTTVSIEHHAVSLGFSSAQGFSAGSCFRTYCHEFDSCRALDEEGECRFPDQARSSLSGLGVNFLELSKTLGWNLTKTEQGSGQDDNSTSVRAGLVLLE